MEIKGETYGEVYGPAMEIKTQEEADRYFDALLSDHLSKWPKPRDEAIKILKSNLGYYSGYYDTDTMIRVQSLFRCEHPIFGKAENGLPTMDEAFQAGIKWFKMKGGDRCKSAT